MSRRTEQVNAMLRDAIQQVITRGLHDPRIRGLITVTEVSVTPDLHTANVSISVLPDERADLTMHGLKAATKHIRRQIGEIVAMRRVPDLRLKLDESLKRQAEILAALAAAGPRDEDVSPVEDDQ